MEKFSAEKDRFKETIQVISTNMVNMTDSLINKYKNNKFNSNYVFIILIVKLIFIIYRKRIYKYCCKKKQQIQVSSNEI